jgi:hypothetical protein
MTCEACGRTVVIGSWPYCPHERGGSAVIADDVPGGFTVENGFDSPRTFYSKSEHIKALAAEGKEIRAKWAGPLDKHMTRWDAPSAKTLADAAVLLSRGTEARQSAREQMAALKAQFPITVTEVKA